MNRLVVFLFVGWFLLTTSHALAQRPGPPPAVPKEFAGLEVGVILQRLGAKMERGVTNRQLDDYTNQFARVDRDGDRRHSQSEYIDNGNYLTPQSRRGIFFAADNDADGFVSQSEYVLNRIITDEAKEIMQKMDADRNGSIEQGEFIGQGPLTDEVSAAVFRAWDSDGNGRLFVPEYLRVWGRWARHGRSSAADRIAAINTEQNSSTLGATLMSLDINKDGSLEKREILQLFNKGDRNGDGVLSSQEIDALQREMSEGAERAEPPMTRRRGKR